MDDNEFLIVTNARIMWILAFTATSLLSSTSTFWGEIFAPQRIKLLFCQFKHKIFRKAIHVRLYGTLEVFGFHFIKFSQLFPISPYRVFVQSSTYMIWLPNKCDENKVRSCRFFSFFMFFLFFAHLQSWKSWVSCLVSPSKWPFWWRRNVLEMWEIFARWVYISNNLGNFAG